MFICLESQIWLISMHCRSYGNLYFEATLFMDGEKKNIPPTDNVKCKRTIFKMQRQLCVRNNHGIEFRLCVQYKLCACVSFAALGSNCFGLTVILETFDMNSILGLSHRKDLLPLYLLTFYSMLADQKELKQPFATWQKRCFVHLYSIT